MKVRVLRPHLDGRGKIIEAGDVIEVSNLRARDMENSRPPLAVPLVDHGAVKALGGNKEVADKSGPRPTPTPPTGGRTGAAKPLLSSQVVRAPATSTFPRLGAKPE